MRICCATRTVESVITRWFVDAGEFCQLGRSQSHRRNATPTARQQPVFASLAAIEDANRDKANWKAPATSDTAPGMALASHRERLASLPDCDEDGAEAPCKVGEIIIEAGDVEPVEVWRRE